MSILHAVVGWRSVIDRWLPFVITGSLALAFWWSRTTPIEVMRSTITEQVAPGGTIYINREVDWKRNYCIDVSISGALIDSMGYHHAMQLVDLGPPSYAIDTSREYPIPFGVPWGKTTYQGTLTFSCFPFYWTWPINVKLPELTFEIVPPTPQH